jgi:hypothetical protein
MKPSELRSALIGTFIALAAAVLTPMVSTAQNTPPAWPVPIDPPNFSQVDANPTAFVAVAGPDVDGDPQWVQIAVYQDDTIFVMGSDFVGPFGNGDTVTWTAQDTLNENWFYFWTARAWDGTDTTPQFGHLALFTVNAVNEPPSAVDLIAPVGDSIVYTTRPSFHWRRATDPDFYDSLTYTVQAALGDCVITFIEMDLIDTLYQPIDPLFMGSHYIWGVEAVDQGGASSFSSAEWLWTYLAGDVNVSRTRTAADVIEIVTYVFKGGSLVAPPCVADTNMDGSVTSADIIMLLNYIFKGGPPPPSTCDP